MLLWTVGCIFSSCAKHRDSASLELKSPPKIDPTIEKGRPVYTEGPYILGLYQQAKDVLELLDKHGIVYWIDGGTLLGAYRSKGIIRWDDDIDICLAPGEEEKFLALKDEFVKLGYYFQFSNEVPYHVALTTNPLGIARLDVFPTVERNGKYFYKNWPSGHRQGEKIFYRKEEVFPLVRYPFGDLQLWGPAKPDNYLIWQYGKTWATEGVQDRTHRGNSDLKKVRFILTEEDLKPAEPFGPLQDSVF
jgi:hypothetical protein